MLLRYLPSMKKYKKQTIKIFNKDIGIEFRIKPCAMTIMKEKSRKIEQHNQELIRTLKEILNYKYLGILVTNNNNIKKAYLKRTRHKLGSKNLIKGLNNRADRFLRYLRNFLKEQWNNSNL